jgi:S1-C subfamily serine protease
MRLFRLSSLALILSLSFGLSAASLGEDQRGAKAVPQFGPERPAWVGLFWRLRPSSDANPRTTLFVCGVNRSGPAGKAGLLGDDLIEEIDGKPLTFRSIAETLDYFAGLDTTQEHVFKVRRGEKTQNIRITAIEMPPEYIPEWSSRRSRYESVRPK